MSGSPFFQVVTAVMYLGVIYGIIILMSPWYFRKFYQPFVNNEQLFKITAIVKTAVGILILMLGIFMY